MNFPLFIARRYFFSSKKKTFINVISAISMLGVGLGICFLIIVLSVFNGLEDLLRSLYSSFDADAKITLVEGKMFPSDNIDLESIENIEGVKFVTPVLEDIALLRYNNAEMVVMLKGVGPSYKENKAFTNTLVEGKFQLYSEKSPLAIVGRGVQYALEIGLKNDFYALQFIVPKNLKPGNLNPAKLLNKKAIMPSGAFAIQKQIDEKYVIAPLSFARDLFEKKDKYTSIEVCFDKGADSKSIIRQIKEKAGKKFKVLNRESQHAEVYKLLKIEKIFVFATFSFILLIASFNVFFTLSMLAIEKRNDLSVLHAMGLSVSSVKKVFLFEGILISGVGAILGLFLGLALCLLQQKTGFISMGMEAAIMDGYPVKIELPDVIFTILIMTIITYLASFRPASLASKALVKR